MIDSLIFAAMLAAVVCVAFLSVSLAAFGFAMIFDAIRDLRELFKPQRPPEKLK